MKSRALVLASVLAVVSGGALLADQVPEPEATSDVFRSAADLVSLNVIVTDRKDKLVSGLTRPDFVVLEDGIRQDVSFFASADVPLDLALLLDTSASMLGQMDAVRTAASGFVRAVRGVDRVMVIDIKQATRLLQPLTGDMDAALGAIEATTAGGGTGLYNGLYLTLRELMKARRTDASGPAGNAPEVRRQAIVVLSDGRDTSSMLSFDDVMEIAREAGIAIYTINLQSPVDAIDRSGGGRFITPSEYSLKELARETGARAFFPAHVGDLKEIYGDIASELASQYALAYVPRGARQSAAFHRISVQLPNHPGFRPRTRSGYTAGRAG